MDCGSAMKKFLYFRFFLFTVVSLVFSLHAYDQIGIKEAAAFPFPIKAKAYQPQDGLLFVGAHQVPPDPYKGFSIALAGGLSKVFTAYVEPEKIRINAVADQKNPLRGATIAQMSLLTNHPFVATDQEPAIVQLVQFPDLKNFSLLRSDVIRDAQGNLSSGILALAALSNITDETAVTAPVGPGMVLFAAVKPQAGVFGDIGSGIAIVAVEPQNGTDKSDVKNLILEQKMTKGLNTTSPEVKISGGSNLVSLSAPILVADPAHDNVYIGLQGVGGAAVTDGLQALVGLKVSKTYVGQKMTMSFSLFDLIPQAALNVAGDYIIAAVGASKQVSIFNQAVMQTTTHLPYLVVVGGAGDPANTQTTVYALPLVSQTGRLASKTAVPVQQFSNTYPFVLKSRAFTTPVTTNADLYLQNDIRVQVGFGGAPGRITDMVVSGDAVFISVAETTGGLTQPGIFYSQALFDSFGRIKHWTQWQRCSGLAEPVWGLALDEYFGNFWAFTGQTADTINTVKRTKWGQQTAGLGALYNQFFPTDKGGAQGLLDFSETTPGFSTNAATRLAVTILTGYQQVLLAQTGISTLVGADNLFGPNRALGQAFVGADGTLRGFAPGTFALACSGGALASLGAITAAAIVTDGTYGWFVVGGSGGIAVLANEDGTGFDAVAGLRSGFLGLAPTMRWIKLGTTTQVRKLMVGNGLLFALTNTTLERFALNPATVQIGSSARSTLLAQAGVLAGIQSSYFSDALISAPFGLLATSGGLVRVGNGADIATAADQVSVGWTVVPFNESVGPVSRLYGISRTGRDENLFDFYAGNVYFLNAFVGYHQTRLYRFTLDYGLGQVTNTTLQTLPDYFVKNTPTFYLNVGDYRNYLATDGAIMALSQSRYIEQPPYVGLLGPNWHIGGVPQRLQQSVERAQKVVQPLTGKSMGKMLRQFASGSWLVGTDVGLFVNE